MKKTEYLILRLNIIFLSRFRVAGNANENNIRLFKIAPESLLIVKRLIFNIALLQKTIAFYVLTYAD